MDRSGNTTQITFAELSEADVARAQQPAAVRAEDVSPQFADMTSTNPYSAPSATSESPDFLVDRKRSPFVMGFFVTGLFPVMWTLAYLHFISFDGTVPWIAVVGTLFVWGFTFPACIACLFLAVNGPAPILRLVGNVLQISQSPFRTASTTLDASEIKYIAYECRDESSGNRDPNLLVIALQEADDILKPNRHWFSIRRPNCVVVAIHQTNLTTVEVAENLSALLSVPNKGWIR